MVFLGAGSKQRCSDLALFFFSVYSFDISQGGLMDKAKVFWSGRSQAVRLPKEFRFDSDEVRIRRHGHSIILEPIAQDWAWLDEVAGPLDKDFVDSTTEHVDEQSRPTLDTLFE
jgi:antitoxin VapB